MKERSFRGLTAGFAGVRVEFAASCAANSTSAASRSSRPRRSWGSGRVVNAPRPRTGGHRPRTGGHLRRARTHARPPQRPPALPTHPGESSVCRSDRPGVFRVRGPALREGLAATAQPTPYGRPTCPPGSRRHAAETPRPQPRTPRHPKHPGHHDTRNTPATSPGTTTPETPRPQAPAPRHPKHPGHQHDKTQNHQHPRPPRDPATRKLRGSIRCIHNTAYMQGIPSLLRCRRQIAESRGTARLRERGNHNQGRIAGIRRSAALSARARQLTP